MFTSNLNSQLTCVKQPSAFWVGFPLSQDWVLKTGLTVSMFHHHKMGYKYLLICLLFGGLDGLTGGCDKVWWHFISHKKPLLELFDNDKYLSYMCLLSPVTVYLNFVAFVSRRVHFCKTVWGFPLEFFTFRSHALTISRW